MPISLELPNYFLLSLLHLLVIRFSCGCVSAGQSRFQFQFQVVSVPASFCMALSGFSNLSCLLSICLFSSLHFHFSPCSHPHSRSSRYVRNRIQSFIQQVMSLLPLIPIRLSTPIFADFKFPFPSALFPCNLPSI